MRIDRCVCRNVTFKDALKTSVETSSYTIEELQKHINICDCCNMCKPYIKKVLETKITVFDNIIQKND